VGLYTISFDLILIVIFDTGAFTSLSFCSVKHFPCALPTQGKLSLFGLGIPCLLWDIREARSEMGVEAEPEPLPSVDPGHHQMGDGSAAIH